MDTFIEQIIKGRDGKTLDDKLSPFIQNVMKDFEIPGLAIGVVKDAEIVYAKGFGVKNIKTREPVSVTTIFHMASVSKPFSATAIMQMVERGQVHLDAPVITYLPYFKLDDERFTKITVQQMLSHVSGMPDEDDYEWHKPQYDAGALERYVRSLSSKKLLFEPGEKFDYSNMAFECLGDLIAKVSGMSFDDYVKSHILNPAGMAESSFLMPEQLPESWATSHVRVLATNGWDGYPYNRMHGPSSTLHSNALEMCQWAITNLNRGNYNGSKILSPSSYDVLWKRWAEVGEGKYVGLSWFLSKYRGENIIEHGGHDTGFRTHFVLLPDKMAAVVVLCNVIPAPVDKLSRSVLDSLLGFEPNPIIPDASLVVYKTLSEEGLDAAVAQWNSLMSEHPDEYDFSPGQFLNLFDAIDVGRVQDAESIASLCARVLPEPKMQAIVELIEKYSHRSASVVLKMMRTH